MKIVNNRINETIIQDIQKILKNDNENNRIIIENMTPQFKIDLSIIWNTLDDILKIQILKIIPKSWNDFRDMIKNQPSEINNIVA